MFLAADEDSQNESGEWERGFEEWERGEGSGESENEAPAASPDEGRDEGGSSSEEEGEEVEEEESESETDGGREGEGEEEDATQVALGDSIAADNENTVMEEAGVRDVSQNHRGTQCEREFLLRRVGHLPPPLPSHHHATPRTLTPGTPTTPIVYYSTSAQRQWLLELTLVLLVVTLLVTVCSRLSYNWLIRLYSIVPEKPI